MIEILSRRELRREEEPKKFDGDVLARTFSVTRNAASCMSRVSYKQLGFVCLILVDSSSSLVIFLFITFI